MGALEDARAHLEKAEEFLLAAEATLELLLNNAAASNAVSCGINAKDAICLKITGRSEKTESHSEAVSELERAGGAAAELAPTLTRLVRLKGRSQYQAASIPQADAARAVERARRMCTAAREIVTS